jgi:hypothetical protein
VVGRIKYVLFNVKIHCSKFNSGSPDVTETGRQNRRRR